VTLPDVEVEEVRSPVGGCDRSRLRKIRLSRVRRLRVELTQRAFDVEPAGGERDITVRGH